METILGIILIIGAFSALRRMIVGTPSLDKTNRKNTKQGGMKEWMCTTCGFSVMGSSKPLGCPACRCVRDFRKVG